MSTLTLQANYVAAERGRFWRGYLEHEIASMKRWLSLLQLRRTLHWVMSDRPAWSSGRVLTEAERLKLLNSIRAALQTEGGVTGGPEPGTPEAQELLRWAQSV